MKLMLTAVFFLFRRKKIIRSSDISDAVNEAFRDMSREMGYRSLARHPRLLHIKKEQKN
ncbi:hypothetical protein Q4E93_09270 [Flavitalea sp. BT771]|uniref:hypothetical protein n=1 Tax=Flavitalea sp. BT771 TaxID=3063329 RepID=UPI0026E3C97E|nr:hypothetical protein [Flavitalea sp. BT771]MDO6430778.1 hypothetical protein [Flavitalea sp. BT771]MDV6219082.1 hypothetical protein [Flavitalea sp. BT771]